MSLVFWKSHLFFSVVAEKGVPPLGVLKKIFRKYDHVMEPACLYPVTQEKFQSWVALMASDYKAYMLTTQQAQLQ